MGYYNRGKKTFDPYEFKHDLSTSAGLKAHAEDLAKKRKRKADSESTLQTKIIKELLKIGVLVIRINSSVHSSDSGTRIAAYRIANTNETAGHADLVVYHKGKVYMMEIKKPKGRATPKQKKFADLCAAHGVPYHIVTTAEQAVWIIVDDNTSTPYDPDKAPWSLHVVPALPAGTWSGGRDEK